MYAGIIKGLSDFVTVLARHGIWMWLKNQAASLTKPSP